MELVFYEDGVAILTDASGDILWASDSDEEWLEESGDEFLSAVDKADVIEYLTDAGYLEQGERVDVVQDTGELDDDEEEDEDEDEEEDEPGVFE